ncbi:hypothetical protein [Streptomyces sp. NRRL S-350]|uniref:hypothetical protein n=1 Tax=Streptomyces sp. NRRL S-350 TaxID=1463902 RepID=UPI0004BED684|nr:hypothetical protein [Streptomyces sp. NRRL S-350]
MPPVLWLAGVLGAQRRDRTVVRWLAEPDRLVAMPTGIRWNAISLPSGIGLPLLESALDGPSAHRIGPVLHDTRADGTVWLIPPDQEADWAARHPLVDLLRDGHPLDVPDPERTCEAGSPPVHWAHWPKVNGTLTSTQWLHAALFAREEPCHLDSLTSGPAGPPR